jgi:hypothetical protein
VPCFHNMQAFEFFINLNNRSPEYISLFIDDRLRKVGGEHGLAFSITVACKLCSCTSQSSCH